MLLSQVAVGTPEEKGSGMDIGQSALSKVARRLMGKWSKDALLDRTMRNKDCRIKKA